MFAFFVIGSVSLLAGLAWVTYQSGRLLRSVPVHENLLLTPLENAVKAGLVLVCLALALSSGLPPARLGWTLDHAGRDLAVGSAVGLVAQLLVNALTFWAIA